MDVVLDLPRVQIIAARFLRSGDHVRCNDLHFAVVTDVVHIVESATVNVTFLDGVTWIGDDQTPMPVARSRDEASAWNTWRSQLDPGQLVELHQQYSIT